MNARGSFSHDDAYQLAREEGPDLRERRQRTARRALVNGFLADRDYWKLMRFLSSGVQQPFFTIGEALADVHLEMLVRRFDAACGRLDPWDGRYDDLRAKYVVAKYFRAAGRAWL